MSRKKSSKTGVEEEMAILKSERENPLDFKINVKCKTKKQKVLLNSIMNKEISLVLGPAGSGKSFISIYGALQLLKDNSNPYKKIIFIYPVELSKEESIGYLKGTYLEKLQPYTEADLYTMEKIFDGSGKNGKDIVQKLIDLGLIEFKSATFLRGSTIDNAIVLISECQNFTQSSFLKILTRIGTNSKYIFSGDCAQVDSQSIKDKKKVMGVQYAIEKLNDLDEFGIVEFGLEDIIRNDIIIKILKRWSPEYKDLDEEKEFEKAKNERIEDE